MKILIAFATTEGQTRKIAHRISATLVAAGHETVVYDCQAGEPVSKIESFDAFVVAGSVHQKLHQQAIHDFSVENCALLQVKPSAFVSVSLSITFPEGQSEAEEYVADFARDTGWVAEHVHLAAGAVRYLEYDFYKKLTIQHVVLKGREMPEANGNPEFTDWKALDAFLGSFGDQLR